MTHIDMNKNIVTQKFVNKINVNYSNYSGGFLGGDPPPPPPPSR